MLCLLLVSACTGGKSSVAASSASESVGGNGELYNGGDPLNATLAAERKKLGATLVHVKTWGNSAAIFQYRGCPPGGDPGICAIVETMTQQQRDYAASFIDSAIEQMINLDSGSAPAPFKLCQPTATVPCPPKDNAGLIMEVAAMTATTPGSPVYFLTNVVQVMSPMARIALMAHELGHQVVTALLGANVRDAGTYGPFTSADGNGGRLLLDSVGAALAVYTAQGAAGGGPDLGWNGTGVALSKGTNIYGYGLSIALQSDGKIVVGGGDGAGGKSANAGPGAFVVARFNPDGSADGGFNNTGRASFPMGSWPSGGGDYMSLRGLAVQPDGKIIAVGSTASQPTFVRVNSDGTPDQSFATGGTKSAHAFPNLWDSFHALALTKDGNILLAGLIFTFQTGEYYFALVGRKPSDGSADPGFATCKARPDLPGNAWFYQTGNASQVYAMAIQSDGMVMLAGVSSQNGYEAFTVLRYSNVAPQTNCIDGGFNSAAPLYLPFGKGNAGAYDIALMPDGRAVLAGYATVSGKKNFAVARLLADGSLDPSFGNGGTVTTSIATHDDIGGSVHVQPDGKIVVVGLSYDTVHANVAIVRYNADGTLDSSFGRSGKLVTQTSDYEKHPYWQTGYKSVLLPDGRIAVAGTRVDPVSGNSVMAVLVFWL